MSQDTLIRVSRIIILTCYQEHIFFLSLIFLSWCSRFHSLIFYHVRFDGCKFGIHLHVSCYPLTDDHHRRWCDAPSSMSSALQRLARSHALSLAHQSSSYCTPRLQPLLHASRGAPCIRRPGASSRLMRHPLVMLPRCPLCLSRCPILCRHNHPLVVLLLSATQGYYRNTTHPPVMVGHQVSSFFNLILHHSPQRW